MQNRSSEVESLVARAKAGDDEAFSALVDAYLPLLEKQISLIDSPAFTHDEVFSEACYAFHRAVNGFKPDKSVTFGLFAEICVRRHLKNYFMSAKRYESAPLDLEFADSGDEMAKILRKERVESLMSFLKSDLSEYEYKVLLYHIQGYTTAQISKALGCPPKSVDNAKSRVFKRAKACAELL